MKLTIRQSGGALRILLAGEMDHHAARDLFSEIGRTLDDRMPRTCILDLSGVSFMDSSGLAIILRTMRLMAESGGTLLVENPQKQPEKVLSAAGLGRVVEIRATNQEESK
jgi:stage II sporulation protein AA (anti-sigma F factor antagonist)